MDRKLGMEIENLRQRLNGLNRKDQDEILALSRRLDSLIVQYQREVFVELGEKREYPGLKK
ncbi:aspartyl-phosphate phosphatase Spo0E family protein [Desulfofundulus sp.]|uniref:aspartyl-phosphate phosphatase Spo0E family protein n=1 Tax=Desulfofundulus sp. TaxID=2282750 RepID=UPI003C76F497